MGEGAGEDPVVGVVEPAVFAVLAVDAAVEAAAVGADPVLGAAGAGVGAGAVVAAVAPPWFRAIARSSIFDWSAIPLSCTRSEAVSASPGTALPRTTMRP